MVFLRVINTPSLFRQSKVLCLTFAVFSLNLCVTTRRKWFLVHKGSPYSFCPNQRETVSLIFSVDVDSKELGQIFFQTAPDLRSNSLTGE